MSMKFNEYQTTWEDAQKNLTEEGQGMLLDYIDSIPYIGNLTSVDRPHVEDLEIDKNGKRVIDLTNPPILTKMDNFRQASIHFKKHGKFTKHYKNLNPNSDYMQFWRQEMKRSLFGMTDDRGLFISGYNYWYWNYSPIMLTRMIGEDDGTGNIESERIYDQPNTWDLDFQFFTYVDQGEKGGYFGAVLKARGLGFSFKAGSMLARNLFLIPKSASFAFASGEQFLLGDGLLSKTWQNKDFVNEHTAFAKHFLIDKSMTKKTGFHDLDLSIDKGYKSEVNGIIVNKADKIRGIRGKIGIFEEAGAFADLLEAWGIFKKSIQQGRHTFGYALGFGTGNSNAAHFESLEELFYNPIGYGIYELKNVWDLNSEQSTCSFFAPAYMNVAEAYDHDGNSDVIKALAEIINRRLVVKYGASDIQALARESAESPITPQDAITRTGVSIFPISDIKEYLIEIEPNRETFLASHHVGELVYSDESVKWKLSDRTPLRSYPIKESDKSGAIEIFKMPIKGENGKTPAGRYIIGVDPVDADWGTSLYSAFVFDLWTDQIAAEFTGRRQTANENFEITYKMALFYNAKINYENNLKGMFAYFDHRNILHYLMDTPEIVKDLQLMKAGLQFGNKAKGTPANKAINTWARKLLADWMMTKVENEDMILLRKIRSIGLLKEAINWNPDGNFDRISAMGMVMIARAQMYKFIETAKNPETTSLLDDPFLSRNAPTIKINIQL